MSYTNPATPVALTPITVAFYTVNIADNLVYFRGLLPSPAAAGKLHLSNGADTADWLALGATGLPLVSNGTAPAYAQLGTAGIIDDAITAAKIAAGTITTTEIATDTITATNIAPNAIGSSELADSAVDTAAIAAGAVTADRIATDTITATQIAPNAIGSSELADSAVDTAAIAAGAVTADRIATDTITATQIAPNAIGASELADDAVDTAAIVAGAVTGAKLGAGAAKIASGTYTGNGGTTARQITTGFAVKFVVIHDSANDTMYQAVNTTNSIRLGPSPTFVQGAAAVHVHASDGFVVADGTSQGNVNTNTYTWTAFG